MLRSYDSAKLLNIYQLKAYGWGKLSRAAEDASKEECLTPPVSMKGLDHSNGKRYFRMEIATAVRKFGFRRLGGRHERRVWD